MPSEENPNNEVPRRKNQNLLSHLAQPKRGHPATRYIIERGGKSLLLFCRRAFSGALSRPFSLSKSAEVGLARHRVTIKFPRESDRQVLILKFDSVSERDLLAFN